MGFFFLPSILTVYTALSNLLAILSYWFALFLPPVILEPLVFRRPAGRETFDLNIWDDWRRLPIGWGAVIAVICVSDEKREGERERDGKTMI